jgi:hypothetical protein
MAVAARIQSSADAERLRFPCGYGESCYAAMQARYLQARTATMQDQEPTRWDDVRVFLAAYRLLSLGMAASRLGVDTSTVSRRIAAFERQLGVQLFERLGAALSAPRFSCRG